MAGNRGCEGFPTGQGRTLPLDRVCDSLYKAHEDYVYYNLMDLVVVKGELE